METDKVGQSAQMPWALWSIPGWEIFLDKMASCLYTLEAFETMPNGLGSQSPAKNPTLHGHSDNSSVPVAGELKRVLGPSVVVDIKRPVSIIFVVE